MRSWLQAVTGLLAAGSALALPHPRHAGKDIATVAGSVGSDAVSIQFSTPCKDCSLLNTEDEVEFDLKVESSKHECDISSVSLNGLSLVPRGWGQHNKGNIAFTTKSPRQSSDVELLASWTFTCLNKEISLLSVKFDDKNNEDESIKPSGFAVSFKQRGQPEFIRLQSQPIRDANAPGVHNEWSNVSPEFQLLVVPPSLEGEIHALEEIQAQIGLLAHQYHQQERKIAKMIKHDFQACHGMKCMLQTAMRKAPDALALIKAHFNCPHKPAPKSSSTMAEVQMHLGQDDLDEPVSSDKDQPQHDELEASSHHPPPPPPSPGHGAPHGLPPLEGEHPPSPHHKPEHHGPPSDDENLHNPPHPGPPFEGFPHHGPPSDHHPPAPWAHSPGHQRPHFRHHGPHHRPLLITITSVLLLLVFALGIARIVHSKKDKLRKQRKRQNRLARCEERRNRVAYRCAAAQHRWSRWWSRFRQPESTSDYDEKRTRIINQESHLEDVMQNEIRDLRRAHEIVGEMVRAEQGRQRLYHEANFGSSRPGPIYEIGESSSTSGSMGVPTLPEYQAPPPSYEAELEGEITVVDGFRYTPSNTGSTPDSSVVDCNSRMSFETGSLGGLKDF